MTIKVILNPYSNRWESRRKMAEAEQALQAEGLTFEIVETEGPNHAISLAAEAVEQGVETIIAAGGDGTVNEVVNGILQACGDNKPPTFGVIPLGTANDLVNNLNLPMDLTSTAKIIASGKTKMLDVGKANERFFVNNCGLGLEPFVTVIQQKMTKVHGIARYLLATLVAISQNPQWKMKLEWEGGSHEGPVTLVSIGNGAITGGVFYMTPHADLFDGQLTFAYGYLPTRLGILSVLPKTMKPDEGSYVEHHAIHEINSTWLRVTLDTPSPTHADGELFDTAIQKVEYSILPGKLPILVGP